MRTLRMLGILVLAAAVAALLLRALVIKIEPGQTGVVNAEWTVGLVHQDFGPGYHWDVGPLHTWTVWDTTVQTMHMVRSAQQGHGDVHAALTVKSKEGGDVALDVTVKYEIEPGKAWMVQTANGPGEAYKSRVFNVARDVMRIALGGLSLEAFYAAKSRKAVAQQMEDTLRQRLAEAHVRLVSILIRDVEFEPRFQKVINEKTLATQDRELNIALAKVAQARGQTETIRAETGAKVTVIGQKKEKMLTELRAENDKKIRAIEADYQRKATETKSDGDLYAAQRDAAGLTVMREAEAEAQRLKREALAVPGGNVLVALELVRNLKLGDITVSTQVLDPLDIEAMVRRLGAQ